MTQLENLNMAADRHHKFAYVSWLLVEKTGKRIKKSSSDILSNNVLMRIKILTEFVESENLWRTPIKFFVCIKFAMASCHHF